MSATGIGNLSTLIKRLEAATSRLEDIAVHQHPAQHSSTNTAAPASRGVATGVPTTPASGSGTDLLTEAPLDDPPPVEAWKELISPKVKVFDELSATIGGNVAEQAKHVNAAFVAVQGLIICSAQCQKPAGSPTDPSPVFLKLIEPIQKALGDANDVKEKNRSDRKFFNHLSAVAEGLPALGWVTVEPKPGPYIEEMKNSGQFYFNRVIKEFKETDKTHVEWCRSFTSLLDEMKSYVMKFHTTGLNWNQKGGDAASFFATGTSLASTNGAPPPPPPPSAPAPPSAPPPPSASDTAASAGGGIDAVFAQINRGEGITGGLRKVDKSEMTHKNPELRAAGPGNVASVKPAPPKPGSKPGSLKSKKPAKTTLEGNKWSIEYHEGERGIVIEDTSLGQTVNVFGCKDTVVQVKGKVNAIQMVSCSKTSILLDTLVSSLELTSSSSFTIQVIGTVPTILIDSCDSGQVYLSASSKAVEIVTAKSSAINISVPKVNAEEGEYTEIALPEQLRHQIDSTGKGIKTEVVAHTG